MIDPDCGVDPDWQVGAVEFMAGLLLYFDDPEEAFDDWKGEAADGDEAALRYANATWPVLYSMNQRDLQLLRMQCRAWRQARRR